jgi:hypothetical protein
LSIDKDPTGPHLNLTAFDVETRADLGYCRMTPFRNYFCETGGMPLSLRTARPDIQTEAHCLPQNVGGSMAK